MVEGCLALQPRLDVLVNCAGVLAMGDLQHATLQQLDTVLDVNLRLVSIALTLCYIADSNLWHVSIALTLGYIADSNLWHVSYSINIGLYS